MPGPDALANLGAKAWRRLVSVHKPLVRYARRRSRARQHDDMWRRTRVAERDLARAVGGRGPIIAGPWLGEVGYEVLYWIPFLRWVQDRFRIPPDRLVVLSRGGVEHWYRGIAARYVDIFDHLEPGVLAARNDTRQREEEGGGRKQSKPGALDEDLLDACRSRAGLPDARVLHPSLLFRLFREVWQGNLPLDFLWTRTDYVLMERPPRPDIRDLPAAYVAMKFYSGASLPGTTEDRRAVRSLMTQVAERTPVVVLETGLTLDDHADYVFADLPNVISARDWMTPRGNLALQTALIAHADSFVGTCGGLAWLAPFLGVPTVAVYADDRWLGPHLAVARQAVRRTGAAPFMPLDLRSLGALGGVLA